MDEKRFKHIVDEHGATKDEHIVELIKYTKELHVENAKLKKDNPGFFKRLGDQHIAMWNDFTGEGKLATSVLYIAITLAATFLFGTMSHYGYSEFTKTYNDRKERVFVGYYLSGDTETILGKQEVCTYIMANWKFSTDYKATGCIKDPAQAILMLHALNEPENVTFKKATEHVSGP